MTLLMKILLTLLTLLYPLIVFYGLTEFSVRWVSFTLLLLFSIRIYLLRKTKKTNNGETVVIDHNQLLGPCASMVISILVLALLVFSFLFGDNIGLLFYPVIINCALALIFSYSLINPPPVIERLARLTEPELPAHAVVYTRKVTQVWLGFFMINGLIALYTALYSSLETWTLYNGLIAYILIGLLFVIEFVVRLKVKKRYAS